MKSQKQIFNGIINSLQEQVKNLGKLMPKLENRERELKEFERTLDAHVDNRTAAERIIHRQLHQIENMREFTLKFSAGTAIFPHNATDIKGLIWIADNAMRQAK